MSNVALSTHFRDNFYQYKFIDPLNELIDLLITRSSTQKLQQVVELIDFYCYKSADFSNSIASIEKHITTTGNVLFSNTSTKVVQHSTTTAFNALLKVTTAQGMNGNNKATNLAEALVLARKYLFNITGLLDDKKEKCTSSYKELSSLYDQVTSCKKDFINNSQTLHRFEIEHADELADFLKQLEINDLYERKQLLGDPEKDQIMVDGAIINKSDFIEQLSKLIEMIKSELKVQMSFLGKKESIEFKGTDIYDYLKSTDPSCNPIDYCNDLIDLQLIKPKNVTDFQNSSVSLYEWTENSLIVVGKVKLQSKQKQSFPTKIPLFTISKPKEISSSDKFKVLKDSIDESIKTYQDLINLYDVKSMSFEILMFETLNQLEEVFIALQNSISDLIKEFVFVMGHNKSLIQELKLIDNSKDLDKLLKSASYKSKFLVQTQIFQNYHSTDLKTIFGVRLVDLNQYYANESSIIVSETLKIIGLLPLKQQITNWTKNLTNVEDLKEIFESRSKINKLVSHKDETIFMSDLEAILLAMNKDNLGLFLRRYLLELPDSLIPSTEVTVLNNVFKVSYDIDLEHLKTFYEIDLNDNNIEKLNKNTLKLILLYILKLETQLSSEDEKKQLIDQIGLNLTHFILKPSSEDLYSVKFLDDAYCQVFMTQLLESLRLE
ncbi:hypothetical protein CANARDRAFT_28041 [[Candida] arabinofermentans NRRL YB-2248]|uniref:Rho-GAP domain-containing protein n=1 Tax=[Candida] arabinofermentans NRRL YB-2248 TaxID=983967 RepID=A0A1E4T2L2_9ASCO|nr:hypothetical protein CANARDRAFT_28041 [[Candida] arabinofermentans NRRL YB-2248]